MKISNYQNLAYRKGDLVIISYQKSKIKRLPNLENKRHGKIGIVVDIIEKSLISNSNLGEDFYYYIYSVLVGSEKIYISQEDLLPPREISIATKDILKTA